MLLYILLIHLVSLKYLSIIVFFYLVTVIKLYSTTLMYINFTSVGDERIIYYWRWNESLVSSLYKNNVRCIRYYMFQGLVRIYVYCTYNQV